MNQYKKFISPIKPPIRANKNFIYKGKKYPVDFSLVKKYSNYFYKNKSNYKLIDDIEIKPDSYEITDESIPIFIACCQNDPFEINDSTIFSLLHLSIQYDVPVLYDISNQYIKDNQKQLIFQSISFKMQAQNSNPNFDLSTEEDIISTNFFDYIDNDQLISLPVPVLYRIISKNSININSMNLTNQGRFIDFLFKCLDKHKRQASILFMNLDIENERTGVLTKLLTEYSNVFDFNFVNSKLMAKNASFLMNEMQKQKIELVDKIAGIDEENKKQREFFILAQKKFDDSKSELENRVKKLEQIVSEQQVQLERYTKVKVTEIDIHCEPNILIPNSTMTLKALVKPETAFKDGVKWQIVQEVEGAVRVVSMDEKTLVLMCVMAKKVTVVASSLDGSGVTASKELAVKQLKGTIEINVQQDQSIKGRIVISAEEGGPTLDVSRSKYLLNTNGEAILGESSYNDGFALDSLVKEVSFIKASGDYFLHAYVVDNFGNSQEFVSQQVHSNGAQFNFEYTGSAQPVQLDPGSYRLEVWGAQGGSFNSTYYGGYGGYSEGTIKLTSRTTLYVVVGKSASSTEGGYNGGGSGRAYTYYTNKFNTLNSYGGGGSSHIGLKPGELSNFLNDYLSSLLIVAGGGGGAAGTTDKGQYLYNAIGGCGGGFIGSNGNSNDNPNCVGTGGTQSQGGQNNYGWNKSGSFGHGSDCDLHQGCFEGSGGGGGFYGGGSGGSLGTGGGGSGYINTSKLTDASMYGYNVQSSSSEETKTFSTTNVSSDAVSKYAKQNDGYAKITPL